MGNLEKAGVFTVVALLAVILCVAFMNNSDGDGANADGSKSPGLNAAVKKPGDRVNPNSATAPNAAGGARERADRSGGSATARGGDVRRGDTLLPSDAGGAARQDDDNGRDSAVPPKPDVKDPPKPASKPNVGVKPADEPKPASEWPKKVKVAKSDSLWAIVKRTYGDTKVEKMMPAVMAANPGLRPTAMKIGDELTMPAPPASAAAAEKPVDKKDAPASRPAHAKSAAKPAAEKSSRALGFLPTSHVEETEKPSHK